MMYLSRIDQTHASEWFSSHERFELEKKIFMQRYPVGILL